MAKAVVYRFVGDAGQLLGTFKAIDAQASQSMRAVSGATAAAGASITNRLGDAATAVAATGATMRNAGRRMTLGFTLPLGFVAKAAVGAAMDYEQSMNILQSVTNATGHQMADFGKLAQQLGADVHLPGTSAADAGEAMTELAKAGLQVGEVMAATRGVLQLSAASGLENADAAAIAAGAMNAFGLKGEQVIKVADMMAAVADASSLSVKDVADSMNMAGGVFGQAGIPIEDFITSLGLMAKFGYRGSDAGTALKTMLLRLSDPSSKEAAQIMSDLGISAFDAAGNMLPMRDIVARVTAATAKMTDQQRANAASTIFGTDAIRTQGAVLAVGTEHWDGMKEAVLREGYAAKAAAARNAGAAGAIDALKSALETFGIKVVLPLLPHLTTAGIALADMVTRFAALPKPVQLATGAVAGLLGAAGPLLSIFGAILSPIGLVVAALGVLGAVVYAVLNPEKTAALFDSFRDKWAELAPKVAAAVRHIASVVWTWIQTNVPIIVAQLAAWGQAFYEWLLPMIPPLLQRLGQFLGAIGTWILDVGVPALAAKLEEWIPAFLGWVAKVAPPLIEAMNDLLKRLGVWIVTDGIPKLAAAGAKMAAALYTAFGNILIGGLNKVLALVGKLPGMPDLQISPLESVVDGGGGTASPGMNEANAALLGFRTSAPLAAMAGGGGAPSNSNTTNNIYMQGTPDPVHVAHEIAWASAEY